MPYLMSAFATSGRRSLWLGLLIAASVAFTLGFACAVPFAAFGAIAAMTLQRRDALLLILGVWAVNQVIGFTVLHYPWDGTTMTWGVVLGAVALLCTAAARLAVRGHGPVVTSLTSFAAAFLVYEGGLYVVSAVWLGGTEDFATAIVLRILAINAAAFAGFMAAAFLLAAMQGAVRGRLGRVRGTT
jgi:hypothetical protein